MSINAPIKLAENTISNDELIQLSNWILETPQLTKGPLTLEFEDKFAEYIGSKYAVFVNSGSSANLLMFYALLEGGFLRNKKAIIPAISWITTLSPALQIGLEVSLCDADPNDLGLDLEHFEYLCKSNQGGVAIMVHVLGHPNQINKIKDLCIKYDIVLLEDACEALGTEYNGKKIGNTAFASSFSFYFGHHISTIEGGIVTTNNKELYEIMLSIRSHGWVRDLSEETQKNWCSEFGIDDFKKFYSFFFPGFNLRSTDLNAFIGILQLKKIENISKIRQLNFEYYSKRLQDFYSQKSDSNLLSNFAYGTLVENPFEVFNVLKENNIECRPLICGSMGNQPFWIKKFGKTSLKIADQIHSNGIYLPNHTGLNEEKIEYICSVFKSVAIPYKLML